MPEKEAGSRKIVFHSHHFQGFPLAVKESVFAVLAGRNSTEELGSFINWTIRCFFNTRDFCAFPKTNHGTLKMDLLEEVIPSTNHPCFFCILGSILGLRGVVKMLGAVVVKLNPFFAGKRVENCVFFLDA